jgi:hypothetical protein
MAIDFPDSPTPGQEFQGYYWDDSKQAWRSQSTNRGSVITSATTPTGATAGDLWFNTVDGTLFVYYDDGITTQWVEVQANVDNYKTPSENYIINGAFDIWQRGTSFASQSLLASSYTADRFHFYRFTGATGATLSRVSAGLSGFTYAARLQRNSGNTSTTNITLRQTIESLNSRPLAGKQITFSFYARAGLDYSAIGKSLTTVLKSGTGTDEPIYSFTGGSTIASLTSTLTTSWTRFFVTGSVNSNSNEIGFEIDFSPTGTAGTNDWFEITGVQLEEGTVATPFRRNQPNIQAELEACQRYFYLGGSGGVGRFNSSTTAEVNVPFPVTMRRAPNVSHQNNYGMSNLGVAGTTGTGTSLSGSNRSLNGAVVNSTASGSTGGIAAIWGDGIAFNAEL